MPRSDMSSRRYLACLVVCLLTVVSSARLSPDPRVSTLFSISEDIGFPRVHETWVGNDPCQWYGIYCSDDGVITTIALINSNLTGFISPRFAELSSLTEIDLSHNRLTGTIPLELLIELKNLTILDVSFNDLHGKIPGFRKDVVFAAGNPQIEKEHEISKLSFVWIGIGIGLLVAGVIGVLYYYLVIRKKISDSETEPETTIELEEAQPSSVVVTERVVASDDNAIPFHILSDATGGFSEGNLIGKGGFSVVYRGKLPDGTDIAVKRMGKEDPLIGLDTFTSEVGVLSKIHHRNLVVLLGYCLEGDERLLVYQLMQQGPLSKHLYDWRDHGLEPLDWTKRLTFALDVARGIEYLHTLTRQNQSYIHRDLKPSNILLGDDLRARVSDFGLVRSTTEGKDSFTTVKFSGTVGYLPPEYTMAGRISRKLDVYSFGVVLMELLTGQKAVDKKRSEDPHIAMWFINLVKEDYFENVIDKTIQITEENRGSIAEVAKLASYCCAKTPEERPEMSYAVTLLASLTEQWKPSEIEETRDEFLEELGKKWWHEQRRLEGGSGPSSPARQ